MIDGPCYFGLLEATHEGHGNEQIRLFKDCIHTRETLQNLKRENKKMDSAFTHTPLRLCPVT